MKRLNLSEITGIAEIVGSVGIIVSLIFVGLQLRENTKQADRAALETNMTYFASLNNLAQAPETAGVLLKGLDDFDALSPVERVQFDGMLGSVVTRFMPLVLLYQQGKLPQVSYDSMKVSLASTLRSPGAKVWWAKSKHRYGPFIQAVVADLEKQYPDVKPLSENYKFSDETQ